MREVIKRLVRESLDNLAKGNYKLNYMLNSVNDSYFYNDDRTLRFNIERLLKDYGKLKPHKSEFGHIRRSSDYDNLSDDEISRYNDEMDYNLRVDSENNKMIDKVIELMHANNDDSPSTVLMKYMGFDGVDSRGAELNNCSNLFTDSSDGSFHVVAMHDDLYYYVIKRKRVTLEHMSPEEFFNALGGFKRQKKNIDYSTVKDKIAKMKNGIKLDMPYLMYDVYGSNVGHEGRHRMVAAMEMGCNSVPVMVEKDVSEKDVMALANKVGDLELDDMIKELKAMGFKNFAEHYMSRIAYILRVSKEKGYIYGIF